MLIVHPLLPSLLLLIAATLVALYARSRWVARQRRPTAATGALLLWCGALWMITNAFEIVSLDVTTATFWKTAQFFGILPIPILWLYLALQFTEREHELKRIYVVILSIIPVLGVLLALTNPFHHLFWANIRVVTTGSSTTVLAAPGEYIIAFYGYGYTLLFVGTYILTRKLLRSRGFRWQGAIILFGAALTAVANILDWSNINPLQHMELTPIALSISIPLFVVTMMRAQRADIISIARGTIIQSMDDVVIVLDLESHIIDLNAAAETLIGQRLPAVVGKPVGQVWSAYAQQFDTGLLQPAGRKEIRIGSGDQPRVFDAHRSKLTDWRGLLLGQVIVLREVTERVFAEEALRASEERYRQHFAQVNDVIYSYDTQLRLLTLTPSVERYLGLNPSDYVGKPILELGVLPPEYLDKAAREAIRVLNGERIEGALYEFIGKNGSRLIAEISSSPLTSDGVVIGAINVARDITERIRMDERLRASLEEKEVLLREIHHRVKNNLQIIASLLSLQAALIDDAVTRAQFEDSQNRIRMMAMIHERLYRSQDMSRIDFGEHLLDLTSYLMQGYQGLRRNIGLQVAVAEMQLDIDAAIPCGLIVNELISNALRHAFPDGGGGMIRVEIRIVEEGVYRLTVQDNGVGMPEINLDESKSLGLQLVNSLTRQLKGSISVDVDDGTTISITFPVPEINHR